jgi:GT2 family glycosyltransferase
MRTVRAITVHHQGKAMLERCLRSLLDSKGVELDVVVVANGCDEELPEIVASSPRVRLVECPEPRGFAAANNLGVTRARDELGEPDFYYFVNNDTASLPATLSEVYDILYRGHRPRPPEEPALRFPPARAPPMPSGFPTASPGRRGRSTRDG